jgi:thymidylate kinase
MIRKTSDTRHPRSVSFSGIDGAGKSTQIKALQARLNNIGARVLLVTFWNDVARLRWIRETTSHTLFKGDKGVGTPARPVSRRDKNVQSWYMTALRFGLYFVDAISLRFVVKKALRADVDVVIFDRYLYDELANLSLRNKPRNRIARTYVRLVLLFVPQPDIRFLVDADSIQARARKPEYPLDFLYSSRESYLTLSELVGGMTILAPQAVGDVERRVLQEVLEALNPDSLQERPAEKLAGGEPRVVARPLCP